MRLFETPPVDLRNDHPRFPLKVAAESMFGHSLIVRTAGTADFPSMMALLDEGADLAICCLDYLMTGADSVRFCRDEFDLGLREAAYALVLRDEALVAFGLLDLRGLSPGEEVRAKYLYLGAGYRGEREREGLEALLDLFAKANGYAAMGYA